MDTDKGVKPTPEWDTAQQTFCKMGYVEVMGEIKSSVEVPAMCPAGTFSLMCKST